MELLALLEKKYRERARKSLVEYTKYIVVPGAPVGGEDDDSESFYPDNVTPAEHHVLLLHTLHMVAKDEIKRLMIFMPPGSAKAPMPVLYFPPGKWVLGQGLT